jgi:hypothetical protein
MSAAPRHDRMRSTRPPHRRRLLSAALALACLVGLVAAGPGDAGQPPPGAFKTPFTVFRAHRASLRMSVSLVDERIGWDAHALVACANGSQHHQLLIEGGRGGPVSRSGRFRHVEFFPTEAGEQPPSARRVTIEDVEEGAVYGVPAEYFAIEGRVLPNKVVGRIRFWEGPGRTPGSLHFRCGTGSADGRWVKFSLPRVKGPAQPNGRPSRGDE